MFFILNPQAKKKCKETFGFRSTKNPPMIREMKAFEDDLFNLVNNIKYKPVHNEFQEQMKTDKQRIVNSKEVIVSADKTSNMYKMDSKDYSHKVMDNITKEYKKCNNSAVTTVVKEAAQIARSHSLEDRIDAPTHSPAFITIKDHKAGFPGRVECRLINPAKNHIGKISKHFLDRINKQIRHVTGSNQWQNTSSVINWFNKIPSKSKLSFFKFDIVNFYPSISESVLLEALAWAKQLTHITNEEANTIMHCRKSFLFYGQDSWVKKGDSNFDVGQGSLDSAEVCELVGLFILNKLENLFPKKFIGLYRDDGLAVSNLPGPDLDKLRKEVTKIFSELNRKSQLKQA